MIKADKLSYYINDCQLFEDLSFEIQPQTIFHIQASNGAGKTTLLQILSGLKSIDSGDIIYLKQSIYDRLSYYQQQLLFIGHQNALQPVLTISEHWQLHGIQLASYAKATDYFDLSAYDEVEIEKLSFGQQKKASLMQLMLIPKQIWLLDEPFVGLDKQSVLRLMELIQQHIANKGTVVLTSHQDLPDLHCQIDRMVL